MTKLEKAQYYISIVLKIFIAGTVVIGIFNQDFFLVFASLFVLFLTFLPAIISRSFKIYLPTEIDFVLTLVLYLHFALGEYGGFYVKFSWWDIFLHAGNSIIIGLVGLVFAYALLMTSRIKAKPFFIALFSLSFSVAVGALWEIFEFGMDQLFGFNMQKSGLMDTMTDLIVDLLGAFLVSLGGFIYLKNPKPRLLQSIVKKFITKAVYKKDKNY